MFFKVRNLSAHNARNHVAHAVIVADFLVLVPRRGLTALRAPLAHTVGIFLAVGKVHAAAGTGDNLVPVKADGVEVAETSGLHSLVASPEAFGGIFDEQGVVTLAYCANLVNLRGRSIQVNKHDQLHVRINFEGLFQSHGIHVPGIAFAVDNNGLAILVGHRVERRSKRHVAAENLLPVQRTLARLGHSEQTDTRKPRSQMQRRRPRRERYGILHAHLLGHLALHLVDILPDGAHPVGLIGLLHVAEFIAMHGGASKPDSLFETHRLSFKDHPYRTESVPRGGSWHGPSWSCCRQWACAVQSQPHGDARPEFPCG